MLLPYQDNFKPHQVERFNSSRKCVVHTVVQCLYCKLRGITIGNTVDCSPHKVTGESSGRLTSMLICYELWVSHQFRYKLYLTWTIFTKTYGGYHKIKHFACHRDFFVHEIPRIKHFQWLILFSTNEWLWSVFYQSMEHSHHPSPVFSYPSKSASISTLE